MHHYKFTCKDLCQEQILLRATGFHYQSRTVAVSLMQVITMGSFINTLNNTITIFRGACTLEGSGRRVGNDQKFIGHF